MVFGISPQFLPISVTCLSIETEKVMYLSVFSPKQVNCFSNFLLVLLWQNDHHNFIQCEKLW